MIIQDELEMLAEQLQRQGQTTNQAIRQAPLLIEIHVTGGHSRKPVNFVDLEVRPLLRISCEQAERIDDEEGKLDWNRLNDSADTKSSILESSPWLDVTVKHGRAPKVIEQHFPINELSNALSITVMSCGPAALCDEVRMQVKATSSLDAWGSVDYIEECFSW